MNKTFLNVCKFLKEVYDLTYIDPCCNERYLHHYFSQRIKDSFPVDYVDYKRSSLHPEWATANSIRPKGGKYKKENNKYFVNDAGTSGFIDFALGNYENTELGIEFKVCESFKFESLVFDYMKLMDKHKLKALSHLQ